MVGLTSEFKDSPEPPPELSVVIPVCNEESNIDIFYRRISSALKDLNSREYIFVDDGSQDNTLGLIKDLRKTDPEVKYLAFSRNFGHQVAITAGLDYARGNAVVVIDGDLQDPPEIIPKLFSKYREGFDVVYAVREARQGEGFFKKITAKIFYRLLKRLTGFSVPVDVGDFRLLSRRAVSAFNCLRERQRFVRGLVSWLGFPQTGVKYVREARYSGKSKYGFRKMLKLALDGLTAFSYAPLRVAVHLGFWISGGSLLYILYILWMKIFTQKAIQGWASLMVAIFFFGGVQLITLGIIGEYIGRISEEVKQRPLYIISEKEGLNL